MNNMLDNLKEKMNETVLRDVDFHEKNKEFVWSAIKKNSRKRKFVYLKPKLDLVLSISACCILLLGIGYFSANKLGLLSNVHHSAITKENNQDVQPNIQEKIKDSSIFTPPKQDEYFEDMTKEEVLTKMLNSIDYFQTAVGMFEANFFNIDDKETITNTEYKISTKNKIGGYEKQTIPWEDRTKSIEIFYDNQQVWQLENHIKIYRQYAYQQQPNLGKLTVEEAFGKDNEGNEETKYREKPPLIYATLSLFPYEMAANYTRNYDMWEIEKQNEEVIGHNTIVLKGTFDSNTREKYKANSFRLWVDKDTGILVKYETYQDGKVREYLYTKQLIINAAMNMDELVPNLNGYEKMDYTFEYDPREEELKYVADGEDEDAKKIVDQLKINFPLFEFTDPELELKSASIEAFREYKQGYLSYQSLKYDNSEGPILPFITVKEYHEDSYVRPSQEFIQEKTKVFSSFIVNGIEWEGYKLTYLDKAHFIGHKGDFVYEVISYRISEEETRKYLESFKSSN